MKHYIIITNRPKDPDLEITRRVQELLKLRQASCSVYAVSYTHLRAHET